KKSSGKLARLQDAAIDICRRPHNSIQLVLLHVQHASVDDISFAQCLMGPVQFFL
ncbi:hypothetical protein A2U01_0082972, partial [Trifolium medium]|nr:hypothetical protein [Trifolium medium]